MRLPVRVGALLLDLDGTLVDSHVAIMRAWNRWSERYGVDPERVREIMPGRTAVAVIRQVLPGLPADAVARQQQELLDWQVDDTDGTAALPGARELLASLPYERWAVVTACDDRLARARLRAAGLPAPDVLVGCDTVPASKPDPAGYLAAAGKLGVAPADCLVVEDAAAGVAAGRAAGMRVLAVPPGDAELTVPSLARVRVERVNGSLIVRGD
jgi:mannitol-1-/sugar-/sorbitol-6-phosphatase